MSSLFSNITTDGYEYFTNDSMNGSLHDNSNATSSFSPWDCEMLNFIVYTVVAGIICIVGFIANIICFNILQTDSGKKHHTATFLLRTLAVADNLVLTLFFGFSIITTLLPMLGTREKILSRVVYVHFHLKVLPFLNMARTSTVWITVLIAINRYLAVCLPLDAHRLASLRKTRIQVAMVFTLAIIFNLPLFLQYTIKYPEEYDFMTVPSLRKTSIGKNTSFNLVYRTFVTLGLLVFPLILLIIFNSRIIWKLRKADKWNNTIRQNGCSSDKNITVVMVVIIIVFIMCSIPIHIYMVAGYFVQINSCSGWYAFSCVAQVFVVANSSTNFVVYYVLRKSFRHAFCKALY